MRTRVKLRYRRCSKHTVCGMSRCTDVESDAECKLTDHGSEQKTMESTYREICMYCRNLEAMYIPSAIWKKELLRILG